EKGVNVPSDIAITGFESTLIGNYTISPLTTTRQPWDVTAKKAVEMLVAIVRGEKNRVSNEVCRIPFELVVRESCGAHLRSNILTRDKKTPKK
ncbi:MAG: substrate-binding domain-containing protein, partial [Chthoniobacterales bacterium]